MEHKHKHTTTTTQEFLHLRSELSHDRRHTAMLFNPDGLFYYFNSQISLTLYCLVLSQFLQLILWVWHLGLG